MSSFPRIDYYFDVFSPYSWIGFEALEQIKHQWKGVKIQYIPFDLKAAMKKSGNRPPALVPNRGQMLGKDILRSAAYWGIKMEQPSVRKEQEMLVMISGMHFFEWMTKYTTRNALKLLLVLRKESDDLMMKTAREMWQRMWYKDQKIFETEDFVETLNTIGIQNVHKYIDCISDKKVEDELKSINEELDDHYVYGAPWICVYDAEGTVHTFFGSDRFHLIAEVLNMPPPLPDRIIKNWKNQSKI